MKQKLARIISVLTVAPLVAFFTITLLFLNFKQYFISSSWYFYCLFFLTILPISAYPLKYMIPIFRYSGRDGERRLAFILAIIGYVLGILFAFVFKAPEIVQKIFLSYVFTGIVLSIVNRFIGFKASGHACGISGPLTLLYHFMGNKVIWLTIILFLVFWSRLSLRRHTIKELFAGTIVGIVSTFTILEFYQFIICT